ncbi:MAG: type II toxin-antitoxin system VapC family toxin [Acidobacteriota bacterium]
MKLYIDSTVLAAYYTPETLSASAEGILQAYPLPAISELAEIELFSALSTKVERAELAVDDLRRIQAVFLGHLEDDFFQRVALGRHHFRLAREWAGRGFDALPPSASIHLATAALEERTLTTADPRLISAARSFGVDALPLEAPEGVAGGMVHEGS